MIKNLKNDSFFFTRTNQLILAYILAYPNPNPNMSTQKKCPVCLENIQVSHATWLPCCHCFHTTCIDQWTRHHSTCPTCRIDIFSNVVNQGLQRFLQYDGIDEDDIPEIFLPSDTETDEDTESEHEDTDVSGAYPTDEMIHEWFNADLPGDIPHDDGENWIPGDDEGRFRFRAL